MKVVRVYTGPDNESHFEDLEVPLKQSGYGSLSDLVPTTGTIFRETPVGGSLDFHNAPRRQFVVNLRGRVEIEVGDGSRRQLGAGDILLADDTTGRGHITRDIEGPRLSLFLPLPDDFDVSGWRT
jgi:hypothetical protein